MQTPLEVQERGSQAVAIFQNVIRKNGAGAYRGAVMLALQEPPRANTEREFFEGRTHGGFMSDASSFRQKKILAAARKAGIDPSAKVHISGLGPPSDPSAWVDSKADILRVCQAKGKVCESDDPALNYEPPAAPPKAEIALAPDIVDGFVRQRLAQDGALREKVKKNPKLLKEVRAAVTEKHAPPSKRKLVKG